MKVVDKDSCDYPAKLMEIKDPPKKLYINGREELLSKRSIAIVGSRKCSEYGKVVAMKIAGAAVANDFCVISGMALGIDNFAHRGALKAGGDTIAVLGTGIDVCYPRQHRDLYDRIGIQDDRPGYGRHAADVRENRPSGFCPGHSLRRGSGDPCRFLHRQGPCGDEGLSGTSFDGSVRGMRERSAGL